MKINKLINKIILIFIFAIICSYFLLMYYSNQLSPILLKYAESRIKQITTTIINNSLSKNLSNTNLTNLIDITRDKNNEIELINYNTKEVTELLNQINKNIENDIKLLEASKFNNTNIQQNIINNSYIYVIPLGAVSENIFLLNFGPLIPLKIKPEEDIKTTVTTNLKEYGINNALIELNLNIEANIQIIIPFNQKSITLNITHPISIELINGKIPNYYYETDLKYKNSENN